METLQRAGRKRDQTRVTLTVRSCSLSTLLDLDCGEDENIQSPWSCSAGARSTVGKKDASALRQKRLECHTYGK